MAKKDTVEKKESQSANPATFLNETKEEFGKVVWPDRQQWISESLAVIFMVSLSAVLISLIDNLFEWISSLVF